MIRHLATMAFAIVFFGVLFNAYSQLPTLKITKAQSQTLFGPDSAKIIMCWPTASDQPNSSTGNPGATYLLDFSASTLSWKLLTSKSKGWMGDPMISWDGTRFLYNTGGTVYAASMSDTSTHESIGIGYDQRWWVHPTTGDEYVMWVSTKWSNSGNDAVGGRTYMRKLTRGTCTPAAAQTTFLDQYALRGGRSADGKFMFTVQPGRMCVEVLPNAETNAFVKIVWNAFAQSCNATYNADINRPKGYSWLEEAHDRIYQGDGNAIPMPTGYCCNVWCEWSTHPDYLITNGQKYEGDNNEYNPANRDLWIYKASASKWTQVSTGAGPAHLWVKRVLTGVIAPRLSPARDRLMIRTTGAAKNRELVISAPGAIRVTLLDANGRRIAGAAGTNTVTLRRPAGMRTGVYLARMETRRGVSSQSVIVEWPAGRSRR